MTKAKWIHKAALAGFNPKTYNWKSVACGLVIRQPAETYWLKVTCPKCLTKQFGNKKYKLLFPSDRAVAFITKDPKHATAWRQHYGKEYVIFIKKKK